MNEVLNHVAEVFDECYDEEEGDVEIDAIIARVKFSSAKIEEHKDQIRAMLMELPVNFRESDGGGWSFLNACDDKNGEQWTGLHLRMDQLFAMGMAAGMVACLLPREIWDALPGGMPYYAVLDKQFEDFSGV